MSLKIIHTSDWHLGQTFQQKSRIEEHQRFIDWLLQTSETEMVDGIIVAGDVFDVSNPSIEALNIYHNFLTESYKKGIQVIIVGGNHDSGSRLNSYKELFKILNVTVVGGEQNNVGEIIPLFKKNESQPTAVVVAVPYLRDGDIRRIYAGETLNEAHGLFTAEVKKHYDQLLEETKTKYPNLSVIGTAHLYINGCVLSEPSENRMHSLVGTLGQIPSAVFSKGYDYVALGHIHKPQDISHPEQLKIRYSGSPIPLSFNERNDKKEITLLTIEKSQFEFNSIEIPLERSLIRFEGNGEEIKAKIKAFDILSELTTWGEIIITEKLNYIEFNQEINDLCLEKNIEILNRSTRISNKEYQSIREEFTAGTDNNPLENVPEIFKLRCEKKGIDEEGIKEIMPLFLEILEEVKLK